MKPLKVYTFDEIDVRSEKKFIINEELQTGIELPKEVLSAVIRMQKMPNSAIVLIVDAIELRRKTNITECIEYWNKQKPKETKSPDCIANTRFRKSMDILFKDYYGYLNPKEIRSVTLFFAKCPHGYDVTKLFRIQTEYQPILT